MNKTVYNQGYRLLLAWLRMQRKDRKLTMRMVASALGVAHSWIGKVEQGERRLDVLEYMAMCEVIGCDPHAGLEVLEKNRTGYEKLEAAEQAPAEGCKAEGEE